MVKKTGEYFEGKPGPGRPKGAPNKTTQLAKDMIADCAAKLGGTQRLVEWAKEAPENERIFWGTIFPKLLPLQLSGEVGLVINISRDDADL